MITRITLAAAVIVAMTVTAWARCPEGTHQKCVTQHHGTVTCACHKIGLPSAHACAGDEIPELQRYQPQVLWPRSMRCYPHH